MIPKYLQLCEYIESRANEYINTGYTHKANTWVDFTGMFMSVYNYNMMFGQWASLAYSLHNGAVIACGCGGSESQSLLYLEPNKKFHTVMGSGNTLWCNGIAYSIGTGDNRTIAGPIFLFGAGGDTGATVTSHPYLWGVSYSQCRIYDFKIYEGTTNNPSTSTLVHHYIPVRNINTSEYGMWDDINGLWLRNSGPGYFIGSGTHVNWTLPVDTSDYGIKYYRVLLSNERNNYSQPPMKVTVYSKINDGTVIESRALK